MRRIGKYHEAETEFQMQKFRSCIIKLDGKVALAYTSD